MFQVTKEWKYLLADSWRFQMYQSRIICYFGSVQWDYEQADITRTPKANFGNIRVVREANVVTSTVV